MKHLRRRQVLIGLQNLSEQHLLEDEPCLGSLAVSTVNVQVGMVKKLVEEGGRVILLQVAEDFFYDQLKDGLKNIATIPIMLVKPLNLRRSHNKMHLQFKNHSTLRRMKRRRKFN